MSCEKTERGCPILSRLIADMLWFFCRLLGLFCRHIGTFGGYIEMSSEKTDRRCPELSSSQNNPNKTEFCCGHVEVLWQLVQENTNK